MISVSDILKILDQIPVWKTLRELPKRVDALEAANKELNEKLAAMTAAPKRMPGETCKKCGAPAVRRISSRASAGPFAAVGGRDEVWTCGECGDSETRLVT